MIRAKNFVEQQTGIRICMPIEMKIKCAIWCEEAMDYQETLIEEIKIRIKISPMIVIALTQFPLVRFSGVFSASDTGGILTIGKKGRVDVNELNSSFIFGQQGGHY
jgi:hypothetical protein